MLRKIVDKIEENALVYSYLFTIPLLFAQVIFRYVFKNPLTWSEELARYLFIWQVWLGSAYCVTQNRHIRIDVFTGKMPEKVFKAFEIVITLITIAFCMFMFRQGIAVFHKIARLHQTSPALKIPMQFVYLCIPVSTALMMLHYIQHIIDIIRGKEA